MDVAQLIDALPVRLQSGSPRTRIGSIVDDSRHATPGCLFIARPGRQSDGQRFIADAARRGAAAVLATQPLDGLNGTAVLVADDLKAAPAALLDRFHGRPAQRLKLVGVTGTNGKTTTTYILRHLLAAAGTRSGLIGTVEIDDGRDRRPSELTTPGAVQLTALMAAMVRHGCQACVMETSSHALDQGRVDGLRFAAGIFTNLTGDHLDYHQTMDAYAAAKARLFESLDENAVAVVNADDPAHRRMTTGCPAHVLRFAIDDSAAEIVAHIVEATARHTDCRITGPWGEIRVKLPLIGRHNVYNVLGALGVAHGLGLNVAQLTEAIAACPQPPGRLERVTPAAAGPFDVLVDYAHTDDALANVLRALRPVTTGRLRVLFGCGGDRDRTKRPRMAATAAELADDLVITSDNPRTEDPQAIVDEILAGVPAARRADTVVEIDRAAAIARIIQDARAGDVVLLAGKGHEDYQIIGTTRRPFDDRLIARSAMESLSLQVTTRGAR